MAMHQSALNRAQRQAEMHLQEVADLQINGPQQLLGQSLLPSEALAVPAEQFAACSISAV